MTPIPETLHEGHRVVIFLDTHLSSPYTASTEEGVFINIGKAVAAEFSRLKQDCEGNLVPHKKKTTNKEEGLCTGNFFF